ncbi:MAG: iron-containing alcohol dehydrogenase [Candidatus Levybacteria bacterium]|nr:iron-containing alcohol dehydrogenase [Candidatus Levybacteria bacterium]
MAVGKEKGEHETFYPKEALSKHNIEFPYGNLRLLCPDSYVSKILENLTTNTKRVKEIDFDVLVQSLQAKLPTAIAQRSTRELLCRRYVAHLDATFPTWRRTKDILRVYSGITEEWQLFDPYNSVMEYVNRKPDDATPKAEYPVALVFPRTFEKRASVLSQAGKEYLGFEELYVALSQAGYGTTILNAEQKNLSLEDIAEHIASSKTRVVGINATAMTVRDGLKVAQASKDINPDTFVVMGGHHISLAVQDERIFEQPDFKNVDAVIVGKGDLSFPLLIDALRRGKSLNDIPDIVTHNGLKPNKIVNAWRAIPLSKFPQIQHVQLNDTYPKNVLVKSPKTARMSTSEGCIGNCSFCTSVKLYDRRYNPRHVRQIVDEMEYLKKYGVETVYFNDDIFIKPGRDGLERISAFCDELEQRDLNMQFRPLLRPDSIPLNEEGDRLFRKLHQNGMIMAFVGFESASQGMLNTMNKFSQADNYKKFVQRAREEGVSLQLGFIAWHPLMTVEDASQNFQFLKDSDELYNFSVMVQKLDIFPGTTDKYRLQQKGLLPPYFNCTTDPQDYQFADPKVGKLADALNIAYKENKKLEDFDSNMAYLHLTKMPEIIHKMTSLLKTKPTIIVREGKYHLQATYDASLKKINKILFTFIQNHLSLYGQGENILETTRDAMRETLPKLEELTKTIEDEIEFIETVCLELDIQHNHRVDDLFSWEHFADRISSNIAISENGIQRVLEKILVDGVEFRVVTDQDAFRKVEENYPNIAQAIKEKCIFIAHEPKKEDLEKVLTNDEKIIVGLGSGTVMDLTKYAAYNKNCLMVLIPTILSTNTFSSPYIHPLGVLKTVGVDATITGRLPDFVMIDTTFLSKQDQDLNRLGYGDIIAVASALEDWKTASLNGQTRYSSAIEARALSLLKSISATDNFIYTQSIEELAKSLTWLSYCTLVRGIGSHPASGSEKIFSTAALELFPDKVRHGEVMALGTLIMTHLQQKDTTHIAHTINEAGIDLNLTRLKLTIPQLINILSHAKRVSNNKGRITVLDKYALTDDECKTIVYQLIDKGIISQ